MIVAKDVAHKAARDRRKDADPEYTFRAAAGVGGGLHGMVDLGKRWPGPLKKPPTSLGQPHAGGLSLEQGDAERVF